MIRDCDPVVIVWDGVPQPQRLPTPHMAMMMLFSPFSSYHNWTAMFVSWTSQCFLFGVGSRLESRPFAISYVVHLPGHRGIFLVVCSKIAFAFKSFWIFRCDRNSPLNDLPATFVIRTSPHGSPLSPVSSVHLVPCLPFMAFDYYSCSRRSSVVTPDVYLCLYPTRYGWYEQKEELHEEDHRKQNIVRSCEKDAFFVLWPYNKKI